MPEIGSIFASAYKEWAWGDGKPNFPVEYFSAKHGYDVFIKHMVWNFSHFDQIKMVPMDRLSLMQRLLRLKKLVHMQ